MIAPVSVARSTIAFGLNFFCAYQSTSQSTRRPSASVFWISIVLPAAARTMSPGRWALPSGMFSTRPTRPTTLALALRLAIAIMAPTTAAEPPMSPFMSCIPGPGFNEIPPVSNVTPLPMSATGAAFLSLPPIHFMTTRREPRTEPCPTPSSEPIPSLVMATTSSTSISRPSSDSSSIRVA